MLETAEKLLAEFNEVQSIESKFSFPFAMAVFGTLRLGWGNAHLMKGYESHHRAFLPHFSARGLGIHFAPGKAAIFEIFTFTPENWQRMISRVDALEGFSPNARHGWYWRTLAYLHVLPENFPSNLFENRFYYDEERVLDIPQEKWKEYPRVPCWVYSNPTENLACEQENLPGNPLIWY